MLVEDQYKRAENELKRTLTVFLRDYFAALDKNGNIEDSIAFAMKQYIMDQNGFVEPIMYDYPKYKEIAERYVNSFDLKNINPFVTTVYATRTINKE